MAFRDGAAAVGGSQQVYDGLERECGRVIVEIDAGSIRLGDLNTGLRELCENAVLTLPSAKETAGFPDTAATMMGAAYDAVAQADAVLAAVQPVREFLKANWPLAGAVPRTIKWQDAAAGNAEIVMDATEDAGFLSGLRPLAVALQTACNTANDNASSKAEQTRGAEMRRARR